MTHTLSRRTAIGALAATMAAPTVARAQAKPLRAMIQFGISYLPLMVMEEEKLLEKAAAELGVGRIELKLQRVSGSTAVNEGLIAGIADMGVMGVPSLLIIAEKTRGGVKGLCGTSSLPMVLNTVAPHVRSLGDFTARDRIATPAPTSPQNIVLRMAAEKLLGDIRKFDTSVVALPHPDAMAAMLSGTEVTAHFTNAPFAQFEAEDKRVRRVLNADDILGKNATFVLLTASSAYLKANPEAGPAVVKAMDEAVARIRADPVRAAAIYLKQEPSKMTPAFVEAILRDPENVFTSVPTGVMAYADFMHRIGQIKTRPERWQDVFHPHVQDRPGS